MPLKKLTNLEKNQKDDDIKNLQEKKEHLFALLQVENLYNIT